MDRPRQESLTPIVCVENSSTTVEVFRDAHGRYQVFRDGVHRHPNCSAEDALRALGHYLHRALYDVDRQRAPSPAAPTDDRSASDA